MFEKRRIPEQTPKEAHFFGELGYPKRKMRRQIISEQDLRRKIEALKKHETVDLRYATFDSRSGIGIKPGVIAFYQTPVDGIYHSRLFLVTTVTMDRNGTMWAGGIITHSGKGKEDLTLSQAVKRRDVRKILQTEIHLINLKRITQLPFDFQ